MYDRCLRILLSDIVEFFELTWLGKRDSSAVDAFLKGCAEKESGNDGML